jgi:hypothetical protein
MERDVHVWAAVKLRELIARLRVGVQLGNPIPYPWKERK